MNTKTAKAALVAVLLGTSGIASADFGVGVKAGTLGAGIEGRWSPVDWVDVRVGVNRFDYDDDGSQAGINYDATFALDSYYATGNFRFPLSPVRFTAGIFSNGNELQMVSADTGGTNFDIGGVPFTPADVGTLTSVTSFSSTAPYVGMGFDFEILDKVGFNLDFGVLWQGEPNVSMQADGLAASQQVFIDALEAERLEIEDEVSDYKAWPVISLGFVYNF